jgi:hypothetical protein
MCQRRSSARLGGLATWALYYYNTSFHTVLRTTLFQVVYAPLLPYTVGAARTVAVDNLLRERDELLAEVREHLLQAQQVSKRYYDANHCDLEFVVGDWVWLRLLHQPTRTLDPRAKGKLIASSSRRAPVCMRSSTWAC